MKQSKKSAAVYIAMSTAFLVVGLLMVMFPNISATVICCTLGAVSLIFGVVKIISYFHSDAYGLAFQFDFALGIFTAVIGAVLMIHSNRIIALLPILIGILIFIDSAFKLQTAIDAKRFGLKSWWAILAFAVVSALLGILLILHPFEGADLIMIIAGITLMIDGLQNICMLIYAVKYRKSV